MSKELIDVLIGWIPMLLLIVVWVFILVKMRPGGGFRKSQKDHLDLRRRQVEALERIAAALEKQS